MNKIYTTELIKKLDSKGSTRYWIGYVIEEDGLIFTSQEYWSVNIKDEESVHQIAQPTKVSIKNVGKVNQTSLEEQAINEITSLYNKKIDEGYGRELVEIFLPMLAQKFDKKKATFPAYIQPKLDGMRASYINGKFYSRKRKELLPEITSHIQPNSNSEWILDGEIMLPPPHTFQETISAIKKKGLLSDSLIYYIFDCYNSSQPNLTFEERTDILFSLFNKVNCIIVPSYLCYCLEDFESKATEFISQGYEGAMYRSVEGVYKVNIRSSNLLKYKEFSDDEFKIVDVEDGDGREEGCAIFTCITEEGLPFNVRPKLSLEERKVIFSNKERYIGLIYTVRYQDRTKDNIPRFPVGISIRDYE